MSNFKERPVSCFPQQKRKCTRLKYVCSGLTNQVLISLDLEVKKGKEHITADLARRAKDDVKYVLTDATSGVDTVPSKNQKTVNKSAPSRYRLAAHQYMVAKKKGLINEPRTRTRALQFKKVSQTNSTDSEATLDYLSDNAPPPRKRRRRQK